MPWPGEREFVHMVKRPIAHHILDIWLRVMDCQEGYHIELWRQLLMGSERDKLAQELVANLIARILKVE